MDVEGNGRNYCVVCSASKPHNLSQTVYSVMETFLLMCHEMARPPQCCAVLPTNPIKKTLTRQQKQDSPPLDSACQGCPLSSSRFFCFFFCMKKGLSLDYHLTSCTHSSNQMLPCDMLCVFSPSVVTQWVAFFLCSSPPLHQHTNI